VRYFSQLKAALFLACLYPLLRLFWLAYTDRLGANPIEFITRSLGTWTLVFLLITLSITPMRNLSGWPALIRLRRMAGLFAFFYALLHFITYLWLDQFFDLEAIYRDVIKRPFITLGFAAFVLMIPLAITSTNAMMKKLGGKRWQMLHRLIYAVAIFAVLHYWWLVKKDITQPLIYAAVLALLLAYRLWIMHKRRVLTRTAESTSHDVK
jgi:sulfoxide reductase heme-binding subunit YedZ